MRPKLAQRWLARSWFTALLFAALLSRALIPLGFMPGPGGIVLCSGYAPVSAMPYGPEAEHSMPGMDMSGNAEHAHVRAPSRRHEGVQICLFSAVAKVMAVGHGSLLAAFSLFNSSRTVFPPEKSIPRGTIVPTSLPRGPPATA
ncbi:MAG TPA: hypothetical protein VIY90_06725 [Steroidobacteraceae bacterium]